jgi:hypothetical protein
MGSSKCNTILNSYTSYKYCESGQDEEREKRTGVDSGVAAGLRAAAAADIEADRDRSHRVVSGTLREELKVVATRRRNQTLGTSAPWDLFWRRWRRRLADENGNDASLGIFLWFEVRDLCRLGGFVGSSAVF